MTEDRVQTACSSVAQYEAYYRLVFKVKGHSSSVAEKHTTVLTPSEA